MKTLNPKSLILVVLAMLTTTVLFAQQTGLQYFRSNNKDGLNVFETSKENDVEFDGLKVWVGGDFALQFQGLSHTNAGDTLPDIGNNFNLPTANLNLDVQLADGLRMHLRTYLSSRHHTEAYVKGGYIQMDKLDFIKPGFLSGLMNYTTIRVGMDEFNYGDTHFRRSDNARAIYNPFVGNYIMDAFSTEPFAEVTVQNNGLLAVVGITNGRLNQNVLNNPDKGFVFFGKLGYDKQINDDLRVRLTGSFLTVSDQSTRNDLYAGDRAGARYYNVLTYSSSDFRTGRFNPGFNYAPVGGYINSFQITPFVKFQGLEFFGVFENASNGNDEVGGAYTQTGAEVIYRFGAEENIYLGGRYNAVSGEDIDGAATKKINRLNIGGGWFLTKNVLAKLEYVKQAYDGDGWNGTDFQDGQFDGIVLEATIGF
ncbi:hypothetical protein [Marinoscillum pacificum]|uniref:hypothetical protein n=1 Tax=Marinoscillum pacificum TaxID=392723 RepID=UPI002157AD05|nr:hypothetical protein [Marinoscillum pacificum]